MFNNKNNGFDLKEEFGINCAKEYLNILENKSLIYSENRNILIFLKTKL
jgi:hypothetical protein